MMNTEIVRIPLSVPEQQHATYRVNYLKATCNTGRLFIFAADQKIEHLNKDFYGNNLPAEIADPQHLFEIANKARIGAFATHMGLISRYAADYTKIRYLVKLNGKTNLMASGQADPESRLLTTVSQVVAFKNSTGLDIVGVGLTVYLGSEHESAMLSTASMVVEEAHKNGLLVVLWMYPRGKSVPDERHPDVIAGAAGVAVCLGADFVKVNAPFAHDGLEGAQFLKQATVAAGNTQVLCAGGSLKDERAFLQDLHNQIHIGGTAGAAIGRNIFQRPLAQALIFCNAVASIVYDNSDVFTAQKLLE
jgi:fructose-bisphosphate aldolase/6-deoxy-5-ketofructose 1-phosphate synthase